VVPVSDTGAESSTVPKCPDCGDQLATDADHGWVCTLCGTPQPWACGRCGDRTHPVTLPSGMVLGYYCGDCDVLTERFLNQMEVVSP
jgi:hypothetical protein